MRGGEGKGKKGKWDWVGWVEVEISFAWWAGGSRQVPPVEAASSTETPFSSRDQRYFAKRIVPGQTREPSHGPIHSDSSVTNVLRHCKIYHNTCIEHSWIRILCFSIICNCNILPNILCFGTFAFRRNETSVSSVESPLIQP